MKKLLILTAIFLTGCVSNKNSIPTVMEKSIMEKMSIQEMNECIKFDPFMNSVFEKIEEYDKSHSDIEKANYYSITYKRAYEYLKYIDENDKIIRDLYHKNKYSEAYSLKIKKDTLCNEYFYPKASTTPPPVENNKSVIDTSAAP